ncbi:DUF4139 domain-containing protein [Streptomyces sp. NPDC048305]|uniref:DUF4139 domain-containing protein n=1 Tax=Streptomyces sp. NPDC048305 TaxID=3365532 RepID=UPI00371329D5
MTDGTARRWASALDSVVVYGQGAVCRRVARGTLPENGRVRVTGLPRSLDRSSLRARVPRVPGARVSEARVEIEARPHDASALDRLRREVEELTEKHAALLQRRNHVLRLVEELRALRPTPPPRRKDDPHRQAPVEAWLELADFVDVRLADRHSLLVGNEEELRVAEHELSVAADKLARASTDAPPAHVDTTVSALVVIEVPDGGTEPGAEVELEVEYEVPGAVWVPAYRLLHRRGENAGRLVMRASIAQRTGEDWTGVSVGLATADLRRGTGLPRLRSLRIGRRQPSAEASGWREPPPGLADLFSGYDAAGPRPAAASGARPAPPLPAGPPVVAGPPALQSYGGPPSAPPAPPTGVPAPAARARTAAGWGSEQAFAAAPMAPAALGAAASPPPPPNAPVPPPSGDGVHPGDDELDYAALILCGPDEHSARRGRIFPGSAVDPVAAEQRRLADSVSRLRLPGHAVRPNESAGSFDHRFDAAARADIPSDGSWHTVTVGEITVGTRTEHLCVPSVEETVYATLVLTNPTDQALLAGPVEVTVDDEFLLTAALPTLAPGGVRRLGLGPAEGIQVTRRTNLRESTSGLRNNVTVLDHRVHVEIANRLGGPVSVEVQERVPVTSDADVRIEERADWAVLEEDLGPDPHAPGTRAWRLELPAGGTAVLDGGYEIRIPAGKALAGGNRRS